MLDRGLQCKLVSETRCLKAKLADMAAAIVDNRDHRCSLDRALHAVDVMTSIIKSGESGQFIDLTTTCDRPAPLGPNEAQALLR